MHNYKHAGLKMSDEGKLRRGQEYHKKLELNKNLPKDKWLTLPSQVDFNHPDVLFFLSKQVKPQDPPKAEPPAPKKKVSK